MMNVDKKGQNNQETKKTEQNSQGDQFRQPSIYSRHDDVCFWTKLVIKIQIINNSDFF